MMGWAEGCLGLRTPCIHATGRCSFNVHLSTLMCIFFLSAFKETFVAPRLEQGGDPKFM